MSLWSCVNRLFKLLLDFMSDVLVEIRHVAVDSVCSLCIFSVSITLIYIFVVVKLTFGFLFIYF